MDARFLFPRHSRLSDAAFHTEKRNRSWVVPVKFQARLFGGGMSSLWWVERCQNGGMGGVVGVLGVLKNNKVERGIGLRRAAASVWGAAVPCNRGVELEQ